MSIIYFVANETLAGIVAGVVFFFVVGFVWQGFSSRVATSGWLL